MPKVNRNFFWPITDAATQKQLELFIRLSIVRGVHHSLVLEELVRGYNERFLEENPLVAAVTLIDEKGLIKSMRRAGTPVSRIALVRYRASPTFGCAKPDHAERAVPLFWTDGRRVVYNLEGCGDFFKQRQSKAA